MTVAGDDRITRVGKFLRLTKLDELPQFWNVLRGDMSLVGPRPEVPEYVELFRERYRTVLTVRPGITDLASIRFRNEEEILSRSSGAAQGIRGARPSGQVGFGGRVRPDQYLLGDISILFRTAVSIVRGH